MAFREQGEQLAQRGGSRQKDLAVLQLSEQWLLTEGEYIAGKQSLTEQGVHKLQWLQSTGVKKRILPRSAGIGGDAKHLLKTGKLHVAGNQLRIGFPNGF